MQSRTRSSLILPTMENQENIKSETRQFFIKLVSFPGFELTWVQINFTKAERLDSKTGLGFCARALFQW